MKRHCTEARLNTIPGQPVKHCTASAAACAQNLSNRIVRRRTVSTKSAACFAGGPVGLLRFCPKLLRHSTVPLANLIRFQIGGNSAPQTESKTGVLLRKYFNTL